MWMAWTGTPEIATRNTWVHSHAQPFMARTTWGKPWTPCEQTSARKMKKIPCGACSTLCLRSLWESLRSCLMCVVWCKRSSKFPCCSSATCRYPKTVVELSIWKEDCAGRVQTIEFVPGKFTKNHRPLCKISGCRLLSASYQRVRQKPLRTPKWGPSSSRRKTANVACW